MKDKKNILMIILMGLVVLILCGVMFLIYIEISSENKGKVKKKYNDGESQLNNLLIQAVHENSNNENYMISPYSLEIVLAMVKEGASGSTYEELDKVIKDRDIKFFSVKDRINVSNALFIKDGVKVNKDYENTLIDYYDSKVIYDKFKTPDKINDWAKKETYGMIPKVMEEISDDFLLGLGNAVAIDVEWYDKFLCYNTKLEKFEKTDGKKINVAMMHNTYEGNASYYKDSDASYVSIPYEKYGSDGKYAEDGTQLEFIGILPENDVDSYIRSFNFDNIDDIIDEMEEASAKLNIEVSLPKFKFDYEEKNLINIMRNNLNLKGTFSRNPNFEKITDYDMSISNFIHKTFIDLSENGTKAAAVTLLTYDKNSIPMERPKIVEVNFDRPFVYLIKDKDSEEILFFGVVYSPTEYSKNDVLCEDDE